MYKNGKKDGFWQIKIGNNIEKGYYINGIKEGQWITYDKDNNEIEKGSYTNGEKNGLWVIVTPENTIETGEYKNGKKTGVWDIYDFNENYMHSLNYPIIYPDVE